MPPFHNYPAQILMPLIAAAFVGLTVLGAHGEPSGGPGGALPLEVLKKEYLDCERSALAGVLGTGDIMRCSTLYEELKLRAFDGDFRTLKEWYDAQKSGLEIVGLRVDATSISAAVIAPKS